VLKILSYPWQVGGSANPYVSIVNESIKARGPVVEALNIFRPAQVADALHVHWFEAVYTTRIIHRSSALSDLAFRNLMSTVRRVKARGGRLVWTAHNLQPHDAPPARHVRVWERWAKRLFEQIDVVICLSEGGKSLIEERYETLKKATFVVAPHPHYIGVYTSDTSAAALRASLALPADGFVIGCIGLIRGYKRIVEAIRCFREAARDDEYFLVAGACFDPALLEKVYEAAAGFDRVRIIARVLGDHELANLYEATDVALFNHEGVLNSGAVLTALSLDRPVIAPAAGALPELARDVGRSWCQLFEAPLSSEQLRTALDHSRASARTGKPDLSAYDPARIADIHIQAYRGRAVS
jgi:beta-1,4-mannosyltransferase